MLLEHPMLPNPSYIIKFTALTSTTSDLELLIQICELCTPTFLDL